MTRIMAPLASYSLLHTHNPDDAQTAVSASLAPHRLTTLGSSFELVHNAAQLSRVSLHFIDYGGEVEVRADGLDFQLTQIPLAGTAAVDAGHRTGVPHRAPRSSPRRVKCCACTTPPATRG